ncbi:white collar one B [Radiomyces spectabilis]|uniref:white collar one B n=1 Tax=Radiomyces spectabilis TaxID=64574 RepID=UPI00221FCEE1|nr:white collar one B [Radiomyces spectabilis]KAI8393596.1 white collar one B [Radiomyces spectabilis]
MDPYFDNISSFNPQLYESTNIPPPTDRMFDYSGYAAGLITTTTPSQFDAGPSVEPPMNRGKVPPILPSFQAIPSSTTTSVPESNRYSGMYTSTGFDMLSVLSRVVNRPNPQINLGPIDLSCSFVVVDARQYDFPIIYASPMFERLTGYAPSEVVGRNCRFLQAPDGRVVIGSRRKYTDNTTVYHIKMHMVQGKESQSSIINYQKTGQPFVNLLTIIPIAANSDEIEYFVGLQADLVEQPNTVIRSMKDGTYVLNYRNITIPQTIRANGDFEPDTNGKDPVKEWIRPPSPKSTIATVDNETPMNVESLIKEANTDDGRFRRCWHELLLDQSPDMIHVLTIKGIFLYVSKATETLLGYKPSELLGKLLKDICHPSDLTTVMRELKQASSDSMDPVNLIYRVRKKNSDYMWIECSGKLRNEDGRGRKYVVLSGRERPMYQLPRRVLGLGQRLYLSNDTSRRSAYSRGADDHIFWSKLSMDGLLLYTSWACANILGIPPNDIIGMSLYQLMRSNRTTDLTRALAEVKEGKIVHLQHILLNHAGMEVMVDSVFYPDGATSASDRPSFVLMQTKVMDADTTNDASPAFVSIDPNTVEADTKETLDDRADDLKPSSTGSYDQMVEELNIARNANWQYELHQLRINNKRLRDELGQLIKKLREEGKGTESDLTVCSSCFRRLPGLKELPSQSSQKSLLCNTCTLNTIS